MSTRRRCKENSSSQRHHCEHPRELTQEHAHEQKYDISLGTKAFRPDCSYHQWLSLLLLFSATARSLGWVDSRSTLLDVCASASRLFQNITRYTPPHLSRIPCPSLLRSPMLASLAHLGRSDQIWALCFLSSRIVCDPLWLLTPTLFPCNRQQASSGPLSGRSPAPLPFPSPPPF